MTSTTASTTAAFRGPCAAALALALAGCATPPHVPPPAGDALDARCERAFAALDREVDASAVRDAEATRIAGFPSLRATRFLASFAAPGLDARTFAAWHARLVDEDRRARRVEIANLPPDATRRVRDALAQEGFGTLAPAAFVEGCGAALARRDAGDPARRAQIVARAVVPDDYEDAARIAGLYPLVRIPFAAGVRLYERAVLRAFAAPAPPRGRPTAYAPDGAAPLAAPEVRALLQRGRDDPLGVPPLRDVDVERLLATYAPILVVDERDANDRPGRPRLADDGSPAFVPAPLLFGRVAHTRFGGTTRVQLVYTAWFAARPPAYPGDPLAGRLDGVLWRVTLRDDGTPLVFDSIHACGCYQLFVPTAAVALRPPLPTLDEQALVPVVLPPVAPGARVLVALEAGSHQVRGVRVADAPPGALRYRIAADDALSTIALPGGGSRSLYGPDGLVAGTGRSEALLFWPLGIRSAGAMRQWGRHATAFVGRRHFDEAFLLDRYFLEIAAPAPN